MGSAGSVKKSLENAKLESEGKEPLPSMSYFESAKAWAWRHLAWVSVAGLFITAVLTWKLNCGSTDNLLRSHKREYCGRI